MKKEIDKILLITVRADYGGGPRHVDVLVENIEKNVYIACPKDKPYFQKWKGAKNVSDICVLPHRKFTLGAFYRLLKFCKRNKIAIIHSHGKGAGFYGRLLKLFLPSLKVIHTYHGVPSGDFNNFKSSFSNAVEKCLVPLTTKFINVSYSEQNECYRKGILPRNKSSVIYNGIRSLKKHYKSINPIHVNEKFVVTSISRFDYQKNMAQSLSIAEQLKGYSKIVFLWIGDGNDRLFLESEAKKKGLHNIIFTGFRTDIDYLLTQTNLCLSTSRWEGLPIALIEATSLGIPIVASDVVGNNEVVENGENGYLFPQEDIDAACNNILKLYNDKELYKRMSSTALNRYHTYFTSEKMIKSLENIYNNI